MKIGLILCTLLFLTGCFVVEQPYKAVRRSRTDTVELKLKHAQLAEELSDRRTEFSIHPFGGGTKDYSDKIEEKQKMERELLKRYRSGDKEAYLPIFGDISTKQP